MILIKKSAGYYRLYWFYNDIGYYDLMVTLEK